MAAPSTAPTPLDESLTKFLGGSGASKLSPNQVTYGSTVPSSNIGYDPNNQFRPQGDILTINAEPGTGASTAETWSHELELERQKQDALEFEFQQQQEADRLAQEAAELAITQAEEARQAGMYGYEAESARLSNTGAELANAAATTANQLSAYDLLAKQRAEQQYQSAMNTIVANDAYAQFRGQGSGYSAAPITQQSGVQYANATKGGVLYPGQVSGNLSYSQPMTYQSYNLSGSYKPMATYQPVKTSQQINPATGTFYMPQ